MKRLITLLALFLLPVWAQGAYAQFLVNGPVSINLFPNNLDATFNAFSQFGPGSDGSISAQGFAFCSDFPRLENADCFSVDINLLKPGTSLIPSVGIWNIFVSGTLNSFGPIDCEFGVHCMWNNDAVSVGQAITFPTNGKDFAVTLPAFESGIFVEAGLPDGGGLTIDAGGVKGELALNFEFIPGSPGDPSGHYLFLQGKFTSGAVGAPEPGPLGLMVAGLTGLLGVVLKRRKLPRGVPMNPHIGPFGTDPARLLSAG